LQDKALVAQLRRYIAIHGLESRVNWLEFVRHSDMAAFLDGFDAFLHPSCHAPDGDHEATPVVLLEAQACGLPVLASTHFDLPAEVLHGQTGLLAPEGDAVVTTYHLPLTTYHLSLITYHLSLTTYHLPLTTRPAY
jgi:colanic acid/amylovoran biosynthesis glycosyltransferase